MVRVRFAPSPTGSFHIGGARTALFNYLFAKKNKGKFILRIEDTDVERSNLKWEKEILDSLLWLKIKWDGKPYRQSERIKIYEKYLKKLLEENKAYFCFCTPEELEGERQEQLKEGKAPKYSGRCAILSKEEAEKFKKEGRPSVIRFRVPSKIIAIDDLIRGKIKFDTLLIGDTVIAKDEKTPLYNFSCAVDDFEMKISHVIRGEDHISNTPKQILIQEALNFPRPKYAHIPLTLGRDRTKLSKRHGAVSISEYKNQGYLAEAMVNFMALLGWNPGTEKEIFSMKELIKEFSLEKMTKSGAIFNIERLDWMNGYYIRQKSIEDLTKLCIPYLIDAKLISPKGKKYQIRETDEEISENQLQNIVRLSQERLKKLSEIGELTSFFFKEKLDYNKELLKWKNMSDEELKISLEKLEKIISKVEEKNFKKEVLEKLLMEESDNRGVGPVPESPSAARYGVKDRGKLFWPLRVALSGKKASPGPCEIAEVLGKEKTLKRIKEAKILLNY